MKKMELRRYSGNGALLSAIVMCGHIYFEGWTVRVVALFILAIILGATFLGTHAE